MEVDGETGQQGVAGLHQAVQIVPPAMAADLAFEIAPDPLDQIEPGRIGRRPGRAQAGPETLPVLAQLVALVVADGVEHHDGGRAIIGQPRPQVVEGGGRGRWSREVAKAAPSVVGLVWWMSRPLA